MEAIDIVDSYTLGGGKFKNDMIIDGYYVSYHKDSGMKYIAHKIDQDHYELFKYHPDLHRQVMRHSNHDINIKQQDANDPKYLHKHCFDLNKSFCREVDACVNELAHQGYKHDAKNKRRYGVTFTKYAINLENFFKHDVVSTIKKCRKNKLLSPDLMIIINDYQIFRKKGLEALLKKHTDNDFFINFQKNNPKKNFYEKSPYGKKPSSLGLEGQVVLKRGRVNKPEPKKQIVIDLNGVPTMVNLQGEIPQVPDIADANIKATTPEPIGIKPSAYELYMNSFVGDFPIKYPSQYLDKKPSRKAPRMVEL